MMALMMMKINPKSNLAMINNHLKIERPQILKSNLRIKTREYLQVRKQRRLNRKSNPNLNEGGDALVPGVVPRSGRMQT